MPPTELQWTTAGLLDHFVKIQREMQDRAFCFVLGAGASASSGIPTGGQLVWNWLGELQRQLDPEHDRRPLAEWATAANLGIPGFEIARAAEFYPQVFELRFNADPDEGYAALESVMQGREPSIGYSVLAQILATMRHRVIITTNFDNLVADALSDFTDTYPFVCGHESLTGFVRSRMRRPLLAKIHRDLLMAPISDPEAVAKLQLGWEPVLRDLLKNFSPIFIGYGGNDGSLMNLLDAIRPGDIAGRLIWCYWHKGGIPSDRIRALVAKHRGVLVPILGFDELMLQLGARLELPLLDNVIEERARERATRYRKAVEDIRQRLGAPAESREVEQATAPAREALAATIKRKTEQPRDWWGWDLKARSETDPAQREQIYLEALEHFPRSAELASNLASHLAESKPAEAERYYRLAVELEPDEARHVGDLADFLATSGRSAGEADNLYLLAVEQDPQNVTLMVNFAGFVARVRREPDAADRLYRRALGLTPQNTWANGQYARFLAHVRRDDVAAERHFLRTRGPGGQLDPYFGGHHAAFLAEGGKDLAEAERIFRELVTLCSDDPHANVLYAGMLLVRGRDRQAREAIDRAFSGPLHPSPLYAEAALLRGAISRLSAKDDRPALGRLKALLQRGFGRDWWFHGDLASALRARLGADHGVFYEALVMAVVDEEKVAGLERFPRWDEQQALPLDEPWPPGDGKNTRLAIA